MPSIFDTPILLRPASWWYSSDGRCLPTRELRYVLVAELAQAGHPLAIVDLVERLDRRRLPVAEPVNKTISDALRTPLVRGRVVRIRRGCYRVGAMPKATRSYIMKRAARAVEHYQITDRPCFVVDCPIPELRLGPDESNPWGECWACYTERRRSASTSAAAAVSSASMGSPASQAMSATECSPSE